MSRVRRIARFLSLPVISAFLIQDISWALIDVQHRQELNPNLFIVPKDIGSVKDSALGSSAETIINIKDIHDNYSAQESIVEILENIVTNYDIRSIGMEGSQGIIDTSMIAAFPDSDLRRKTSEYLMREGRMSAAEFFAALNHNQVAVYGMEDRQTYERNLRSFQLILKTKKENLSYVQSLEDVLQKFVPDVYSKDLIELNLNGITSKNSGNKFSERWKVISEIAARQSIDTSAAVNVHKLIKSIELEKNISFSQVNEERQKLNKVLEKSLDNGSLETLVHKNIQYKVGDISQGAFSSFLIEISEQNGVDVSRFGELVKYADYMQMYESVDIEMLKEEALELEDRIRISLFENDDQELLFRYIKQAEILKDMFSIKLNSTDLGYFRKHRGEFDPVAIQSFIAKLNRQHPVIIPANFDLNAIFSKLDDAMRFYDDAEQRNSELLNHTIEQMKRDGKRIGCVITGGFHSRGITDLLKQSKFSYIIILPRFNRESKRPYLQLLMNVEPSYEAFADSELVSDTRFLAAAHYVAGASAKLIEDQKDNSIRMLNEKLENNLLQLKTVYLAQYRAYQFEQKNRVDSVHMEYETPVKTIPIPVKDTDISKYKKIAKADTKNEYLAMPSLMGDMTGVMDRVKVFYDGNELVIYLNETAEQKKIRIDSGEEAKAVKARLLEDGNVEVQLLKGNPAAQAIQSAESRQTGEDKSLSVITGTISKTASADSEGADLNEIELKVADWIQSGQEDRIIMRQLRKEMNQGTVVSNQELSAIIESTRNKIKSRAAAETTEVKELNIFRNKLKSKMMESAQRLAIEDLIEGELKASLESGDERRISRATAEVVSGVEGELKESETVGEFEDLNDRLTKSFSGVLDSDRSVKDFSKALKEEPNSSAKTEVSTAAENATKETELSAVCSFCFAAELEQIDKQLNGEAGNSDQAALRKQIIGLAVGLRSARKINGKSVFDLYLEADEDVTFEEIVAFRRRIIRIYSELQKYRAEAKRNGKNEESRKFKTLIDSLLIEINESGSKEYSEKLQDKGVAQKHQFIRTFLARGATSYVFEDGSDHVLVVPTGGNADKYAEKTQKVLKVLGEKYAPRTDIGGKIDVNGRTADRHLRQEKLLILADQIEQTLSKSDTEEQALTEAQSLVDEWFLMMESMAVETGYFMIDAKFDNFGRTQDTAGRLVAHDIELMKETSAMRVHDVENFIAHAWYRSVNILAKKIRANLNLSKEEALRKSMRIFRNTGKSNQILRSLYENLNEEQEVRLYNELEESVRKAIAEKSEDGVISADYGTAFTNALGEDSKVLIKSFGTALIRLNSMQAKKFRKISERQRTSTSEVDSSTVRKYVSGSSFNFEKVGAVTVAGIQSEAPEITDKNVVLSNQNERRDGGAFDERVRQRDENEASEIFRGLEFHGLGPRHLFISNGKKIYASDTFEMESLDGRIGTVLYVVESGRVHIRFAYKSLSQNEWRVASHFTIRDNGEVSWIGKGEGQTVMSLQSGIGRYLDGIKPMKGEEFNERAVADIITKIPISLEGRSPADVIGYGESLMARVPRQVFREGEKLKPSEREFLNEFDKPNFESGVLSESKAFNSNYQTTIRTTVVESVNKEIVYTIHHDEEHDITWVGQIEIADPTVDNYGLPVIAVWQDKVSEPGIEYYEDVKGSDGKKIYGSAEKLGTGNYYRNSQYTHELPLVKMARSYIQGDKQARQDTKKFEVVNTDVGEDTASVDESQEGRSFFGRAVSRLGGYFRKSSQSDDKEDASAKDTDKKLKEQEKKSRQFEDSLNILTESIDKQIKRQDNAVQVLSERLNRLKVGETDGFDLNSADSQLIQDIINALKRIHSVLDEMQKIENSPEYIAANDRVLMTAEQLQRHQKLLDAFDEANSSYSRSYGAYAKLDRTMRLFTSDLINALESQLTLVRSEIDSGNRQSAEERLKIRVDNLLEYFRLAETEKYVFNDSLSRSLERIKGASQNLAKLIDRQRMLESFYPDSIPVQGEVALDRETGVGQIRGTLYSDLRRPRLEREAKTSRLQDSRRSVQDQSFSDGERRLFIVADGMGGEDLGEGASALALDEVNRTLNKKALGGAESINDVKQLLIEAAKRADKRIFEAAQANDLKMGTAISIGVIWTDAKGKQYLVALNVGDTRIMVRKASGKVEPVSYDDSKFGDELFRLKQRQRRIRSEIKSSTEDTSLLRSELVALNKAIADRMRVDETTNLLNKHLGSNNENSQIRDGRNVMSYELSEGD
ncbi:MAG: protein phosphatase 2C domain-containing protein, partial [Candidatus Omnitrophica bacterium]|nr:protein phosphatase 2C domain-containing protein [Candidatus Omnitrophota bacterium]